MPLKVGYMPHKENDQEDAVWAENTMMIKLMKYTKNIEIKPVFDWFYVGNLDVLVLHNLAHTALYRKPWLRGSAYVERLLGKPIPAFYTTDYAFLYNMSTRPKIIGGIRGNQGFYKAKRFLKYFDAIHVNNRDLLSKVKEHGARKAYLIPPGVDLDQFAPEYDQRPHSFCIGWTGDKNKPMKNFEVIRKLGYTYVCATKENFIPHDEIQNFYNRKMSVFVHPSSHEGYGRGIIEAMACGLPVVSSVAGASFLLDQKWVIPGDPKKPAWSIEARKKIDLLKQFKALRYEVGQENRERVRVCGWDKIANRFEVMCKDIIS